MLAHHLQAFGTVSCLWGLLLIHTIQWLHRHTSLPSALQVATAWGLAAAIGWPALIAWYVAPAAGWAFDGLLVLGLGWRTWRLGPALLEPWRHDRETRWQALLIVAIVLFDLGYLHAGATGRTIDQVAADRFVHGLPIDNELPRLWAEKLVAGDHRITLHADWLTSDRPPLATGVILLLFPAFPSGADGMRLGAHSAGMILQLWWIPAIWGLLRRYGNGIACSVATVAAMALTATPLVHTLYVWPKLAAAAAVITAGVLYFGDRRRPAARVRGAGLCAALAWLAHGSSAFPLLALGLAALGGPWPRRRVLLQTGALAFLLVLPWLVYQQAFAPPANRLAKWHLAGVVPIDDRSTLTTLREAYAALSPAELWQHKLANLRYPFHTGISSWWRWPDPADREDRYQSFYFLIASQGPWNLAWLLLPGIALRRWWDRPTPAHRQADSALAATTALLIGTFLLWALLLFGPGTTSVHQGSLAVPLGLSAALMTAAWRTHPAVFGLLAGWQALIFIRVWMPPLGPLPPDPAAAWPATGLGLLGGLGLLTLSLTATACPRRSSD